MKLRLLKNEKFINQIIDYDILKHDSNSGRPQRSNILLAVNCEKPGVVKANLSLSLIVSVCIYISAVITISNFSDKTSLSTQAPFLGRLLSREKRLITFVMSVRPATFISAGRTFTKFYIWDHYVKLQTEYKFYSNRTKILATSHEDVIAFLLPTALSP